MLITRRFIKITPVELSIWGDKSARLGWQRLTIFNSHHMANTKQQAAYPPNIRNKWYFLVEKLGKTVEEICDMYAISKKTYYKWRNNDRGSHMHVPKKEHPQTKLKGDLKTFVCEEKLRINYGPRKMKLLVKRRFNIEVSKWQRIRESRRVSSISWTTGYCPLLHPKVISNMGWGSWKSTWSHWPRVLPKRHPTMENSWRVSFVVQSRTYTFGQVPKRSYPDGKVSPIPARNVTP